MTGRPTRTFVAFELAALAAALPAALVHHADTHWDLALFLALLAVAGISDVRAVSTPASRMKISASFLSIITAIVLLGELPAMVLAVLTIFAGWTWRRYPWHDLLANLVTYSWFPLLAGVAFAEAQRSTGLGPDDPGFYLLVLGTFALALALNFLSIAAYSCYVERSRLRTKVRRTLLPLLPSEAISALLAATVVYLYDRMGLGAIAFFAVILFTFQYLVSALLTSQQRADELELRAKQLAGFQVALLSALLRTLDLRDRMTARHSAAVARYARDIAAARGLPSDQQDLAHTAGLLHDIGKFILPDRILKAGTELTPDDWDSIRQHPYEGARIVSQVDGYAPVGDIIVAHHERFDGLGYPRGLRGEEIPLLARIVAVAEAYDVLTARDSYRERTSSFEAVEELRRVAGDQLDPELVEVFAALLADRDLAYAHGEDTDFDAELALDRRIHQYVAGRGASGSPD
jgi:putative nucleotidyltransferase with HDIG domain